MSNSERCICLENLDKEAVEHVIELKCGHSYHTRCIADWIITHGTCPYCRRHDGFIRDTLEGIRENRTSQATSCNLESFSLLMKLIVGFHGLEMLLNLFYGLMWLILIDEPLLGTFLYRVEGIVMGINVTHFLLTLILLYMVWRDRDNYKALGIHCHNYVESLFTWCKVSIVLTLLCLYAPCYYMLICIPILVEDSAVEAAWLKSTSLIYTSTVYLQLTQ